MVGGSKNSRPIYWNEEKLKSLRSYRGLSCMCYYLTYLLLITPLYSLRYFGWRRHGKDEPFHP